MHTKNIFGTDGIRAHSESEILQPRALASLGYALGKWASSKYESPRIIIARDTRQSGTKIQKGLLSGLLAHPVILYDSGILPTPATYTLMHHRDLFDIALIISASHNPYQDNGIKIFNKQSIKLTAAEELTISSMLSDSITHDKDRGIIKPFPHASDIYQEIILSQFNKDLLKNIRIVIDTAHGAAYQTAPALLKSLGAEVITIHNRPNGKNINDTCGSTHTQTIQRAVTQYQADIGITLDGDGDRALLVNRYAEVKDGDDILALLAQDKRYQDQKAIVGTIMSNEGLSHFLKNHNKDLIRSDVGDKMVHAKLYENNLLLGGEPSGHVIMRDYLPTGDGIYSALQTLQTSIDNNNTTLKTFDKLPQLLINLPVVEKKDLEDKTIKNILQEAEQRLIAGRILVRYSGTQNLLRIMVEDINLDTTTTIATFLETNLKRIIS